MRPGKRLTTILRRDQDGNQSKDHVLLEEPLQLTLKYGRQRLTLATILRTPGHDYELALGYLFSLELIHKLDDVETLSYCASPQNFNHLTIVMRNKIPEKALRLRSQDWVHAGCGSCGQDTIEICPTHQVQPVSPWESQWLCSLPQHLRQRQDLFLKCGASHAAALVTAGGMPELIFEDVGRHNAVDKLVGHLLIQRRAADGCWLLLSGRSGFELIQKAVRSRFSAVASVGPPSSLALNYATKARLTLVGFLREQQYSVYYQLPVTAKPANPLDS